EFHTLIFLSRDRSRVRSLQRNRQSISRSPGRKRRRKSPSPRAPRRRTSSYTVHLR
ncbi:hypothetical protein E2320_003090, partial [Naja naja]